MSFIPNICWVKQGAAAAHPEKVQISNEELHRILNQANDSEEEGDDSKSDCNIQDGAEKPEISKSSDLNSDSDEFNLAGYDDEDDSTVALGTLSTVAMLSNDETATTHDEDDDSVGEREVRPDDNLILACLAEADAGSLLVYVYNDNEGDLYVHHDLLLPSLPLAVDWMDYDPADSTSGNFAVVGYMEPYIDIWDIDVMESLEPVLRLDAAKKRRKDSDPFTGHTDSVLGLAWNRISRIVLASASADKSIGIWDLEKVSPVSCVTAHKDKVQCISWHPEEAQTLLSGGFDKKVRVFDCRSASQSHKKFALDSAVECVRWIDTEPYHFLCGTEEGAIYYVDVRQQSPVHTVDAHKSAVTGIDFFANDSKIISCERAGRYKVWSISENQLCEIYSEKLSLSTDVNCIQCSPNSSSHFAVGLSRTVTVFNFDNEKVGLSESTCRGKSRATCTRTSSQLSNSSSKSNSSKRTAESSQRSQTGRLKPKKLRKHY